MQKNLFFFLILIPLFILSCDKDGNSLVVNNQQPSFAGITLPSGVTASTTEAITFVVRVDGVFGTGGFTGTFGSTTGTASFAGLSINFNPLSKIGSVAYQSIGTVSGPFSGNGTVVIVVTYSEGTTVFTGSFVVTIAENPLLTPALAFVHALDSVPDGGTLIISVPVAGGPDPASGTGITDINVRLDIVHPNPSDLDITLTDPSGTVTIDLTSDNGSGIANAFSTVTFDDSAATFITSITGPNRTFKPEVPLSNFNGLNANGTWTLTIIDDLASNTGFVRTVALSFDGSTDLPPPLNPSTFGTSFLSASTVNGSTITSILTVSGGPTSIEKVVVGVRIDHLASEDLTLTLTSPAGTTITLSTTNGTGANLLRGTVFDDDAIVPIASITSRGIFIPEMLLTAFMGEDAEGDWILSITEATPTATVGTLRGFSLSFDGDSGFEIDGGAIALNSLIEMFAIAHSSNTADGPYSLYTIDFGLRSVTNVIGLSTGVPGLVSPGTLRRIRSIASLGDGRIVIEGQHRGRNFGGVITAMGRGSRQMCLMDRYGFPRTKPKKLKRIHGFQTGDLVKAVIVSGKKKGVYFGRVAIRESGSFNIKTKTATVEGISWKHCRKLQSADGYAYF